MEKLEIGDRKKTETEVNKRGAASFNSILFLLLTCVFFVAFSYHITTVTTDQGQSEIDAYSEGIMIADLAYQDNYGVSTLTKVLHTDISPEYTIDRIIDIYTGEDVPSEEVFEDYISNIVIQRLFYRLVNTIIPSKRAVLFVIHAVNALLLSIMLSILIMIVFSVTGSKVWLVTSVITTAFFVPYMGQVSENLYWSFWTMFLPMVVSLLYIVKISGNPVNEATEAKMSFAVAFAPCLLVWLCRFEFSSMVMVTAVLPFLYYAFSKRRKTKEILKVLIIPSIGVLTSFGAAIILKILLTAVSMGSLGDSVSVFVGNIFYRVIRGGDAQPPENAVMLIGRLLSKEAISVKNIFGLSFYALIILGCIGIAVLLSICWIRQKMVLRKIHIGALAITYVCSIGGSLSWIILARPHSTVHLWLCPALLMVSTLLLSIFCISFSCTCILDVLVDIKNEGLGIEISTGRIASGLVICIVMVTTIGMMEAAKQYLEFEYMSETIEQRASLIFSDESFKIYFDEENWELSYIGKTLKNDQMLYYHLYQNTSGFQESFSNEENYEYGYLNYTFIPNEHSKELLKTYLPVSQMVSTIVVKPYPNANIEFGIITVRDDEIVDVPYVGTAEFNMKECSDVIPAELTDANWTNGINNLNPTIVLIKSEDLPTVIDSKMQYTTSLGKNLHVVWAESVSQEWVWLHFDRAVLTEEGYPEKILSVKYNE